MKTIKNKFLLALFAVGLALLISGCAGRESISSRYDKNFKKECEDHLSKMRSFANQGKSFSQAYLGRQYFNGGRTGSCVGRNYTKSMKWFRMADQNGNVKAANYIGTMYRKGWGVPKDEKEAEKWFRKGSDAGDLEATANLGELYFVDSKKYSESFQLFQKAAAGGNDKGKFNVGLSYYGGFGVKQDFHEAKRIFLSLTQKNNHPGADYLLGIIYEKGYAGPKDLHNALYLYKKASKRGHVKAREAAERLRWVLEWSQGDYVTLFPSPTTGWTAGELKVKELKVSTTEYERLVSGLSGGYGVPQVRLQVLRRYLFKGKVVEMIIDTNDAKTSSTIFMMFEEKEFRDKMAKEGAHTLMIKKFHAISVNTGQEKALMLKVGKFGVVGLTCRYQDCEKDMELFSKRLNLKKIERFTNYPHRKSK